MWTIIFKRSCNIARFIKPISSTVLLPAVYVLKRNVHNHLFTSNTRYWNWNTASPIIVDLMDGQKTPVSRLTELCARMKFNLIYELVDERCTILPPSFCYKVTAGSHTAFGQATNKKLAKHEAAKNVLQQMLPSEGESDCKSGGPPVAYIAPYLEQCKGNEPGQKVSFDSMGAGSGGGSINVNAVGQLQELAQKMAWALPSYDFGTEGPSHLPNFTCTARLKDKSTTKTGLSKKLAKQNAAVELLRMFKGGSGSAIQEHLKYPFVETTSTWPNSSSNFISAASDALDALHINEQSQPITVINPSQSATIGRFYKDLRAKGDQPAISHLHSFPLNDPDSNYVDLLRIIAEEHKFEPTYVDLEERSSTDQFQCLLQLSTFPVAVIYGSASSPSAAKQHAAHSALQYLKIMTK